MRNLVGKDGENRAADYLISQHYKIIKRNFRSRFGEIDIIAYDKIEKFTVFIEVRTKSTVNFGTAEESLTNAKKGRLFKTALFYLSQNPTETYRFDLVAINLFKEDPIKHYKNIEIL